MLNSEIIRSHSKTVAAVAAVGLLGVAVCRVVKSRHEKKAKWNRIHELRNKETEYRTELKARLSPQAAKHKEICYLPFQKLVEQLQSGKLKAIDAVHAYQHQALLATENTNCVTVFVRDAEQRALNLDAIPSSQDKKPLHGVPVSLKECFLLEGTEATAGIGTLLGYSKDKGTGALVQFLIDQGCVPFCKTNLPQAMLSLDSRNPVYGMAKNPHDLTRGPGGSSSGEGALQAARGSILGIGSDIGGSTRIPAAWCGTYSMKPTSQRMTSDRGCCFTEGQAHVMPSDFGTFSFMARDVFTVVNAYKLFYTPTTFANNPEMVPLAWREDIYSGTKPLTIGYYCTLNNTIESVPAMKRAVSKAVAALESLGHKVVEFTPPNPRLGMILELEALFADGGLDFAPHLINDVEISYQNDHLIIAGLPNWLRSLYAWWNRNHLGAVPIDNMFAMVGRDKPHDLNIILRKVKAYRDECLEAMRLAKVDAIVGPAFASPACHLDSARDVLPAFIYTCLFNVLNWPAGIVPVTKVTPEDQNNMASYPEIDLCHRVIKKDMSEGSVGLPVAVQFAARPYCEETVLRLMRELESKVDYKL